MSEQPGPFDRLLQTEPPRERDRAATAIVAAAVALGLILLVLVLPPVSILDDDGERGAAGGARSATENAGALPAPPPEGFAAVSILFDFSEASGKVTLLRLSTTVPEGERLTLFSYQEGQWRKVGEGVAVLDGQAVRTDLSPPPDNVAVFSARTQARAVLGTLPRAARIDPRAPDALTELNPLGYAPAADGSLAGTLSTLPEHVPARVVPTVRARGPAEIDAVNTILASEELRTAHVQALLTIARDSDHPGLDIDYSYIDPTLGEEFVEFVRTLSAGLHAEQRTLTLTLPLPQRSGEGWDTLGYDWEALAPLADRFKLAPEPDPEQYFATTEAALEYLIPRVGSEKLLLGIATLSREVSVDGMRTLTLKDALSLASTPALAQEGPIAPGAAVAAVAQNLATQLGASGLRWDDQARALTFRYTGPGGERTVWIANRFSEAFKLRLASRYQLGGVYLESVARATAEANVWPAVRRYAKTGHVTLTKPNGALLQPRWAASAGTLERETGAETTWHAPAQPGTATLTLIVSDGVVRLGQRLTVTVEPPVGAVAP